MDTNIHTNEDGAPDKDKEAKWHRKEDWVPDEELGDDGGVEVVGRLSGS